MDEVEEADRIPDGSQMSGMLRKKRVQNFRPHGRAYDVLALSYRARCDQTRTRQGQLTNSENGLGLVIGEACLLWNI